MPVHDEVHVSCVFTWDIPKALEMQRQWEFATNKPVRIGGPAFGTRGEAFTPGLYTKPGIVFTSRGCNNNCWFCFVPKRDGKLRELKIENGWNVQDDNLFSCSEKHIRAVFEMLKRQPKPAEFTGGIEAKILQPWHIELMQTITIKQMFFAYDTEDDYGPLVRAGEMLLNAGFKNQLRCYNLIGGPGDTIKKATDRLRKTFKAGFLPQAMLYRDQTNRTDHKWRTFQRDYARPALARRLLNADIRNNLPPGRAGDISR
jgi:hypothetical protein